MALKNSHMVEMRLCAPDARMRWYCPSETCKVLEASKKDQAVRGYMLGITLCMQISCKATFFHFQVPIVIRLVPSQKEIHTISAGKIF